MARGKVGRASCRLYWSGGLLYQLQGLLYRTESLHSARRPGVFGSSLCVFGSSSCVCQSACKMAIGPSIVGCRDSYTTPPIPAISSSYTPIPAVGTPTPIPEGLLCWPDGLPYWLDSVLFRSEGFLYRQSISSLIYHAIWPLVSAIGSPASCNSCMQT